MEEISLINYKNHSNLFIKILSPGEDLKEAQLNNIRRN